MHRLRDYDGPPYVVILDEVDQLEDTDVLYDLRRIRNLELLFISNEVTELFAGLDERVASRLHSCARMSHQKKDVRNILVIMIGMLTTSDVRPSILQFHRLSSVISIHVGERH